MTETEIRSQPFSLSQADYVAYYKATYFRTFPHLPWGPVNWFFLVAVPCYLTYALFMDGAYIVATAAGVLTILLWALVMPAVGSAAIRYSFARTPAAVAPRTVTTSPAALIYDGPDITARYAWSEIRRVEIIADLICPIGSVVMPIPKSAFATAEDSEAFVATCRRHMAEAGPAALEIGVPAPGSLDSRPYRMPPVLIAERCLTAYLQGFQQPTVWLVIGLGAPLAAGWLVMTVGMTAWLATAVAGVAILALPALLTVFAWQGMRNQARTRPPRRLTISPQRVTVHSTDFDYAVGWPMVRSIDQRLGAIRFRITGSSYLTVPLSAFGSREEAQAFQNQATAWWRAIGRDQAGP